MRYEDYITKSLKTSKALKCKLCGKPRKLGQLKCKACSLKQQRQRARIAIKKEKKREKRENHVPTLIKKADKAFSDFIRARDKYICQTCFKTLNTSNAHCSHFVGRMNLATRWNEKNCICQCAEENIFKEGNKPLFALYLMKKYGNEIVEQLVRESRMFYKPTAEELKNLIKLYKEKLSTASDLTN